MKVRHRVFDIRPPDPRRDPGFADGAFIGQLGHVCVKVPDIHRKRRVPRVARFLPAKIQPQFMTADTHAAANAVDKAFMF